MVIRPMKIKTLIDNEYLDCDGISRAFLPCEEGDVPDVFTVYEEECDTYIADCPDKVTAEKVAAALTQLNMNLNSVYAKFFFARGFFFAKMLRVALALGITKKKVELKELDIVHITEKEAVFIRMPDNMQSSIRWSFGLHLLDMSDEELASIYAESERIKTEEAQG